MKWLKQLLCWHYWVLGVPGRWNVINSLGHKSGEVTLRVDECPKCMKWRVVPSDRTHIEKE